MDLSVVTKAGRQGLSALLRDPQAALLAFDYDGTLAPIVADPAAAVPHPEVVRALGQLSLYVGGLAIITGRPARTAVELAGLREARGLESLVVLGHYGLERWEAASGRFVTPEPPPVLARARAELPDLLAALNLSSAAVEDKGLSVAVHVRNLPDPDGALRQLEEPLRDLANRYDLAAEPGKRVIELRPRGMDKGEALRRLVAEQRARFVAFVGDDLGDLAAFDEIDRLRARGTPGLLVCSSSSEEDALTRRADVVLTGPDGVADFMKALVERLSSLEL